MQVQAFLRRLVVVRRYQQARIGAGGLGYDVMTALRNIKGGEGLLSVERLTVDAGAVRPHQVQVDRHDFFGSNE